MIAAKKGMLGMAGLLLWALFLGGCTKPYIGYPGPRLPETETALLRPDKGVKIYAIDGRVVNIKHTSGSGLVVTTRAVLRPGVYQLALIPQHIETIKTFTEIRAELDAGQQYLVRTKRISGPDTKTVRYEFWVENIASGRVVSDSGTSVNPFRQ